MDMLVDEEEAQIGADRSSATSNKAEIYNEEARNATQKHKPKRVESVNADAEAFGDHWKILIALCILKLKHKNIRRKEIQAIKDKTGDSAVLKIGDSAKVVIKQDMKGRRHKYGFNNNKREKIEKKKVVDDETGNKHELYEVLRIQSKTKSRCLNQRM
ncbi:hypothetical protein HKD37_20G055632 [Glycine soja]